MLASERETTGRDYSADGAPLDPNIRGLLDHIAAELADEYVRLMEAAAEAEIAAGMPEAGT